MQFCEPLVKDGGAPVGRESLLECLTFWAIQMLYLVLLCNSIRQITKIRFLRLKVQ